MTAPRSFSPTDCSNLTVLSEESSNVDCKTVGFFSNSVKKLVKRGSRVLRARSVLVATLHSLALCFQPRSRPSV